MPSRPVKRRDALENQARIIAAAHEVFSERGIDAPIPEIAARAGVGKATVYRSFPTKADLIAAIATRRLETVRDAARRALETPDPWLAVLEMTAEVLLLQAGDRGLGDALRHTFRADVQALRVETLAAIDDVLARAGEAGVARPDASAQEFRVFISGVARELSVAEEYDPEVWRRYAIFIANVFRA